ncbi:hypothetical protein D9Q98_003712 [Chlorella vulgaris]|uniref:MYND-type domain-containing protein n=1 Tax=Chlorella vulgaris TaxID=3077 RepID=A0A9D4YZP1_CHLVU|nr:hypothetical protein D9Q98_003712 [Chlorella vulgaris]
MPNAACVITSIIDAANELSADDVRNLGARLDAFPALLDRMMASLSDAETAAVDRAIQAGARQLSALGTRMAATLRRGGARSLYCEPQQFLAACTISSELFWHSCEHGMRDASQALYSCATLPLECGLALIRRLNASPRDTVVVGFETYILQKQAQLLLGFIRRSTGGGAGAERFVSHLAAPERLRAWLSANVDRVLALHGTSLGRGPSLDLQNYLITIAGCACTLGNFQPHCTALYSNAALQSSMVQLLLPMLHTVALTVQLPADRRPPRLNIDNAALIADLLYGAERTGSLRAQVALAGDARLSNSAQRVLQSIAQLFAAAPSRCPIDEGTPDGLPFLWISLIQLLGVVCIFFNHDALQHQGQGSAAVPDAQRQHMVQQHLLTPEAAPTWAYTVNSLAEVSVCCAASSALLRALPHTSVLAELGDQERLVDGEHAGLAVGAQTTQLLRGSVYSFITKCTVAMQLFSFSLGSRGPWSAADGSAAVEALWQLHTTLCRAVHSTIAGVFCTPHAMEPLLSLNCLTFCVQSAVCISTAVGEGSVDTSSGAEAPSRHLLAMSVAQAEAVLVAASCPLSGVDEMLSGALLHAVKFGHVGLASANSTIPQMLEPLIERLAVADGDSEAAARLRHEMLPLLHREPQPDDALELAQASASRSCAYLRCANLAGEGGPAARQGAGSQRCSKCKVAWYCGTACSHADWRAGHRRVCRALGAARVAAREQQHEGVEV